MERDEVNQGAKFIKVLCGGKGCHDKSGEKILFYEHNGYVSNGGADVSRQQEEHGEKIALQHERVTNHNTRLIIGK